MMSEEVATSGRSDVPAMSNSNEKKPVSNTESDIIINNQRESVSAQNCDCESSAGAGSSDGDNTPASTATPSSEANGLNEHTNEIVDTSVSGKENTVLSLGGQLGSTPPPPDTQNNHTPSTGNSDADMVVNTARPAQISNATGCLNKSPSVNGESEAAASCADKVLTSQNSSPSSNITSLPNASTEDNSSPCTSAGLSSDTSPSLSHAMDTATASSGDGSVAMDTDIPVAGATETEVKPSCSATSDRAEAGASASTSDCNAPLQSVYHVKWILFKENNTAIITQNENGPCPLLAIMNVLLLQGKVKLPAMVEMVTSGQLMEYLGDCIFEHAPKDISEDAQLNYEQNMHDAMAVFHKLQTGLDVNVKFTGVGDFEYTPECIVFDLLSIPLYHGWLVDPESPEVVAAIGNFSYNQLVEKIIAQKGSKREELMTEALIAEEFLDRTAHQLTYHGLSELVTTVKEDELCVFFRNNHFSTLYKHKNELFVLVTDQGFLTESNVVWETLSNVEGDGHFVDANFRTYTKPEPSTSPIPVPSVPVGSDQQIDTDYMVALSLQQEQQEVTEMPMAWQPAAPQSLSDHELAMRLQEEENRRANTMAQRQQQQQPPQRQASTTSSGSQKKKNSECIVL